MVTGKRVGKRKGKEQSENKRVSEGMEVVLV
jgi:hypothetical protein